MSWGALAMARTRPSAPARWLHAQGLLVGRCLDYGSGRGKDAEVFKMDAYDPFFEPVAPDGPYDTILCTYVLNVLPEYAAMPGRPRMDGVIVRALRNLLTQDGVAYVTVRRDVGCTETQRHVELDLPIIRELSGRYVTYEVNKDQGA